MPPFVAAYGAWLAWASQPDTDEMNTIRPRRRSTIVRPTAWPIQKALDRFSSTMSCHSSSLNSSTGLRLLRPTACTKMSGAPAVADGLVDCAAAAVGGPQVGDDARDRSGERVRRGGELVEPGAVDVDDGDRARPGRRGSVADAPPSPPAPATRARRPAIDSQSCSVAPGRPRSRMMKVDVAD